MSRMALSRARRSLDSDEGRRSPLTVDPLPMAEPRVSAMPNFAELRVADLMTIDPVAIAADASIEDAESLIASYRISGLPVVDAGGRLVGVISKTDLIGDGSIALDALLRGNRTGLKVGELMTAPAITVRLDTTLVEAARIMTDAHIHRLVAVDEQDRPIGVLSASDFVALVAED
jgi:CBS domain-containing protein